jgi:acyl-CoA thioesterase-1
MLKTVINTLLLCALYSLSGQQASAQPEKQLLVLGDSISAAYGIPIKYGWVALLDDSLAKQNLPTQVINASISGETTTGGLSRLPALLQQYQVHTLIIELGGNNALRGQSLDTMREDLRQMIHLAKERGISVLLIGMHIPPNYGKKYAQRFHQTFIDLAQEEQTALVPFLLEGIATREGMTQADGLHPTAQAQPLMLANVLPQLLPLLQDAPGSTIHAPATPDNVTPDNVTPDKAAATSSNSSADNAPAAGAQAHSAQANSTQSSGEPQP